MSSRQVRRRVLGKLDKMGEQSAVSITDELPYERSTVRKALRELMDSGRVERVANVEDPQIPLYRVVNRDQQTQLNA